MNTNLNSQLQNSRYGHANDWYLKRKTGYANRWSMLQTNMMSQEHNNAPVLFGTYMPNLSKERGLVDRFKRSIFRDYIRDVKHDKTEFRNALSVSEKLFSSNIKFTGDSRRLVMATIAVISRCKFPDKKFVPLTVEQAALTLKTDASSGYPYRVKKGLILHRLMDDVKLYDKGIGDDLFKYPLLTGFRLQLRETSGKLNVKTRVFTPYPGAITLIEQRFAKPFIDHFVNVDTFYITGRTGSQIRDILVSKFKDPKVKRLCSTDFTAYDQHVCVEVLQMAFYVLRSQLYLTKQESSLFEKVCDYFCCGYVNSSLKKKDQHIFIKSHGIPSGSAFTNLIGSIAHAIMVSYYDPTLMDKSLICGDDNLMDITSVNFQKYVNILETHFSMVVSIEKTKTFKSFNAFHFLGFDWINFEKIGSPILLINQAIYHTDYRTDLDAYDREVARSASVLLNAKNGSFIFASIFPEVIKLIYAGHDIKFNYLSYARPPTTDLLANRLVKRKVRASLRSHLIAGWLLR